jgi:hypothetical protein
MMWEWYRVLEDSPTFFAEPEAQACCGPAEPEAQGCCAPAEQSAG